MATESPSLVRKIQPMMIGVKTNIIMSGAFPSECNTLLGNAWGEGVFQEIIKGPGSEVRCFRDSFELPSQR